MLIQKLVRRLEAGFGQRSGLNALFYPLSLLYGAVTALRRLIYRCIGQLDPERHKRLGAPVIVIGNVYVGGTGKTPLIMALACRMREQGFRPGIISRGYVPGKAKHHGEIPARLIDPHDPAEQVGDEPRLISQATGLPVAVGRNRYSCARLLVDAGCDVLLSDDGLQHYALPRDLEIAVVDARRGHGNGWLLPAGPLREPLRRLKTVDWVVYQDGKDPANCFELIPTRCRALDGRSGERPLTDLRPTEVHAVAGIGHPERFFAMLRRHGLTVQAHPFDDHHHYIAADLDFGDDLPVLMTAKDAVKCVPFASPKIWVVEVALKADNAFFSAFDQLLVRAALRPRAVI